MTITSRMFLAAILFSSACVNTPLGPWFEDEMSDERDEVVDYVAPVTVKLETDRCDEPMYEGSPWYVVSSPHLMAYVFPGTLADQDREEILAQREAAYEEIRAALGVSATPRISMFLTPSPRAAAANGRGTSAAWPEQNRIEVVYTGASESSERTHYGRELTHVLEAYLDPMNRHRHAFLTQGLAEYLDQSGRDMHEAFAGQVIARSESRTRTSTLSVVDAKTGDPRRAGSFVQLLVERYGMATFLDIFRATAVTSVGGCWLHARFGCIDTPEALVAMLDDAIGSATGDSWSVVQAAWEQAVQHALDSVDTALPAADVAEIENLIRVGDLAFLRGDAASYRSTLDGFYCDASADAVREDISARAVSALHGTTSKIHAIHATGTRTFPTAEVLVRRTDRSGRTSFASLTVEHFPIGWRVTGGPDWF